MHTTNHNYDKTDVIVQVKPRVLKTSTDKTVSNRAFFTDRFAVCGEIVMV